MMILGDSINNLALSIQDVDDWYIEVIRPPRTSSSHDIIDVQLLPPRRKYAIRIIGEYISENWLVNFPDVRGR